MHSYLINDFIVRYIIVQVNMETQTTEDNLEDSSNNQDDELDFTFIGITIPRGDIKQDGVVCPFCKTLQKRINGHIKTKHKGKLGSGGKAFERKLKKYIHARRQQSHKERQDPTKFKENHRKVKLKSRQRLKEENPKRVKASKKRENARYRKGVEKTERPPYPCSSCNKFKCGFSKLTKQQKERMDKKISEAMLEAQSQNIAEEIDEGLYLSIKGGPTSAFEKEIKEDNGEAETESDAEFGGAWEDESDLEQDVDWRSVAPKWILLWTQRWRMEQERIKRTIKWNLIHGSQDQHVRLRWKLRKVSQYLDWLWLGLQKEMKDYEDEDETLVLTEKKKESLNWFFKELLLEESDGILNRYCTSCVKSPAK